MSLRHIRTARNGTFLNYSKLVGKYGVCVPGDDVTQHLSPVKPIKIDQHTEHTHTHISRWQSPRNFPHFPTFSPETT